MPSKNETSLLFLREKVGDIAVSLQQLDISKNVHTKIHELYSAITLELNAISSREKVLLEMETDTNQKNIAIGKKLLKKTEWNFLPSDEFLVTHFPVEKQIKLTYVTENTQTKNFRVVAVHKSGKIEIPSYLLPSYIVNYAIYYEPSTKSFIVHYE